jgi:putative hydrolase of the HAD superfamily
MSSQIQAIFFDLGDTLVRIKLGILKAICETIGKFRERPLKPDEYLIACQNEWKNRKGPADRDLIRSVITHEAEVQYWKDFFQALLKTLGVTSNREDLVKVLARIYSDSRSFECFEDVHLVLTEFKEKGYRLGLISNAFPSAAKLLDDLKLRAYFEHSILSFELQKKYLKPEREIYEYSVEKLGVEIGRTVLVDDRLGFVKAAIGLGMNAYLIERYPNQSNKPVTRSLVPRIKNLFDLRNEMLRNEKETPIDPSFREESQKVTSEVMQLPAGIGL